jgi:hypothetical protein
MIKLPVVKECSKCIIKKVKNKKGKIEETVNPCTKITHDNFCELYENPAIMWSRPGGCIFPNSSSTISDKFQESGIRKFRR